MRNIVTVFLVITCASLALGAVYSVYPEVYVRPDGSYDFYCPINWHGSNYEVRNEIKYLSYKGGNNCLRCGPCGEDGMQCADSTCPKA